MKDTRLGISLAAALALLGVLAFASPANAATPPPAPPVPPIASGAAPHPLNMADPNVAAMYAKIKAEGGTDITGTTTPYTLAPTATNAVKPDIVFPPTCGLSVFLFQLSRSIESNNLTSCSVYTYTVADMTSTISFATLIDWIEIAADTAASSNAKSFPLVYSYHCVNGNTTTFETETYGTLYIQGEQYNSDAYDEVTNAKCGTS